MRHIYAWKLNILMPNWINESPFDNKNYYLWNNRTNWFIYGNNNMVVSFLVFHMLIKNHGNYLITTPLMEYFVADVVTFILKIFTLAWIQFALICIIDFQTYVFERTKFTEQRRLFQRSTPNNNNNVSTTYAKSNKLIYRSPLSLWKNQFW